jgi:SAM-dependent methyltransferase
MLNICVAGWYLEKFDDWYMSLFRLNDKYPVHVVANRFSDYLGTIDLPYTVRANEGLEWGAYNHFLMNIWTGGNTLFCHDDIILNPVVVDHEIRPPEFIFDRIANLEVDQAYIFGSRAEDVENYGKHGRMVFMSDRFLHSAKKMGGFWYDEKNSGYTSGKDAHLREKMECLGYNAGITAFHYQAKEIGGDVHRKVTIPAISMAVRGENKKLEPWREVLASITKVASTSKKRLHLGCGEVLFEDYTNVDLHADGADIKADLMQLPFSDGEYDWIESRHVIEHISKKDAIPALSEWSRVLSPGGHVFISCPDLPLCAEALAKSVDVPELWDGLVQVIYGEDGPGMRHQCGYSAQSLDRLLRKAGFINVSVILATGYRPTPSLLAIGEKQ